MVTATINQVRLELSDIVERVVQTRERVVVTKHGHEEVAIVPMADLRLLERVEREMDEIIARAALAECREQGAIAWEEAQAQLEALRARR